MFRNGKAFKLTSILFIILFCLSACSPEEPGLDDDGDTNSTFEGGVGMQEDLLEVLGVNQLLRVSFIENENDEYVFEVIDTVNSILLKDSTEFENGTVFSVNSPKHEMYEEKGYVYEKGKEYIICVGWIEGDLRLSQDFYIPLDDLSKMSDKEYLNSKGIQDAMTADKVVDKFKEILYPYNFLMGSEETLSYTETEALALFDVVRVKLVERKNNREEEIRTEHVFEVIEWLNDKENQNSHTVGEEISVYSAVYPGKDYFTRSELLWYNYQHGSYRVKGDEYVIVISKNNGKWYVHDHYFQLSNISQMHYNETFNDAGITAEMSPDEIVAKIKELIAEEKAKD